MAKRSMFDIDQISLTKLLWIPSEKLSNYNAENGTRSVW